MNDSKDSANLQAIQSHLSHIVDRPSNGDSSIPTLVFLSDHELGRIRLPIEAGRIPLGSATTNAGGGWDIPMSLNYGSDLELVGVYAGDSYTWPSRSSLSWKDRQVQP